MKTDTTSKGLTKGSVFGPHIMSMIVFSFFQTLSIESIRKMLTLLDLNVSKSTVLKAIATVSAEKFATHAAEISKKLGETNFLMADETRIRIGKKRSYAWAFIGQYGIKIVTHQSRGRVVVDLHCPYYSGGRV